MDQTSILARQNIVKMPATAQLKDRIMEFMSVERYATKSRIALEINVTEDQVHKRLSDLKNEGRLIKTPYAAMSQQTGQLQHIWAVPGTKTIILFCSEQTASQL